MHSQRSQNEDSAWTMAVERRRPRCFKSKPRKILLYSDFFPPIFQFLFNPKRRLTDEKKASQVGCIECIPSRYFLFQIFSVGIFSSGLFWPNHNQAYIVPWHSGDICGVLCVHFPLRFISLFLVLTGGHWCFPVQSSQMDFLFVFSFRENPWLPQTHPLFTPLEKKIVYSFAFFEWVFLDSEDK